MVVKLVYMRMREWINGNWQTMVWRWKIGETDVGRFALLQTHSDELQRTVVLLPHQKWSQQQQHSASVCFHHLHESGKKKYQFFTNCKLENDKQQASISFCFVFFFGISYIVFFSLRLSSISYKIVRFSRRRLDEEKWCSVIHFVVIISQLQLVVVCCLPGQLVFKKLRQHHPRARWLISIFINKISSRHRSLHCCMARSVQLVHLTRVKLCLSHTRQLKRDGQLWLLPESSADKHTTTSRAGCKRALVESRSILVFQQLALFGNEFIAASERNLENIIILLFFFRGRVSLVALSTSERKRATELEVK